jgi:hypothetical protein
MAVPVRLSQELRASVGARHTGRQEDPVPAAADPQEGTRSEEREMTTAELEPLAIYDANDSGGAYWRASSAWRVELADWMRQEGIVPEVTIRADVYVMDAPFAVVHQIELDEDGHPFRDQATGGVAYAEPRRVLLGSLPPRDAAAATA